MALPDPLENILLPPLSPNDTFSSAYSSTSPNASIVWSPSHSHYSSLPSVLTANNSGDIITQSSDRETILFPTYAMRCPHTHEWIIHIRGWALSHNISAVKHKIASGITKNLIIDEGSADHGNRLFEQRFKYFLAKNKRNKQFVIHASGATSLEHQPVDPRDNLPTTYSSRRSSSGSDDSGFQSATEDYYKVSSDEYFKAFDEFSPAYDPILESRPGNPLSTILDGRHKLYVTESRSTTTLSSYEEYRNDIFDESQLIEDYNQLSVQSECTSTTEDSSKSLHSASAPHSTVLKSESNGFYNGQIRVSDAQIQEWMAGQDSRLVQLQSQASGFIPGLIHVSLVEEQGISIISDIDDTIKDTQILSGARTVLTNTFCKEARDVEGMAKAYKDWYDSGASFHYVSNSPFQLLPMLDQFIKDKQFPPGSMHLRVDGSILARLIEVPGRAKRDAIKQIMNDFPKRQFVLIGDSGEIDLEIYARIASEFPGRVLKIFIRDVSKKPAAAVKRRNTLSSLFASPKRSNSVTTNQTQAPPPPPLSENGRAQTLADLAASSSGIHSRVAKAREYCPVDIELFQSAETLQRDPVIWHALCK